MRIDSFSIENFKSIKKIEINNLKEINIFIGKNNAGKSNIMEILRRIFAESVFPRKIPNLKLLQDRKARYYFDQSKPFRFKVKYSIKESEIQDLDLHGYRIRLNEDKHAMLEGFFDGNRVFYRLQTDKGDYGIEPQKQIKPEVLFYNLPHEDNIKRSLIHIPASRPIGYDEGVSTDFKIKKDFHPVEIRQALNALQMGDKNKRRKAHSFLDILEKLDLFTERPDIFVEDAKVDIYEYFGDEKFLLNMKGSGTQLLIYPLFKIFYFNRDYFTIEEPEIHCHHSLQRKILEFIEEEAEGRQFFISTHSPTFVKASSKISLYLVYQVADEEDHTKIETKVKYIEGPEEFYLITRELGIKFSDILLNKKIIFVEGISDKEFYNSIIERLEDIPNQAIFVPSSGSNIKHYAGLIYFLLNLNVTHELFILIDSDKKAKSEKVQEIVDFVRKNNPDITESQIELLKNSIFILEKKAIESYIDYYQLELIEEIYGIRREDIIEFYSEIPEEKRWRLNNLKKLLRKFHKKYRKREHVGPFIDGMAKSHIDPELTNLLKRLLRD